MYEITGAEGDRRTISFTEPAESVERRFERVRREISRDIEMPGFRPGKVPRSVVDRKFGNLIRAEVADAVRRDALEEVIEAEDWILGDRDPELSMGMPAEGEDFRLEMTLYLHETRAPEGLDEIGVELPPTDPEAEEERMLRSLRERMVSYEPVDRPAADGDAVKLRVTPLGEGAPEEQDITVILGNSSLGPGMDGLLEGLPEGAVFEARPRREGGEEAPLHRFTVLSVMEELLPGLDDDLAMSVAGLETLDELRERVRESIRDRRESEVSRETERQVLETLREAGDAEPPEYMVENLSREYLTSLSDEEPDERTLAAIRQIAAEKVSEFLLLRALAKSEGLSADPEELEEAVAAGESRGSALDRLRNAKAVELLMSRVTTTEREPGEGEAAPEPEEEPDPGWSWVLEGEAEPEEQA